MADSWLRFWDRPHRIYVNERHLAVHYRRVADDILSILPAGPGLRVLDYGCGEAREAARIAARVGHLYLYDAALSVQAQLRQRFAGTPSITVLDDAGLAALGTAALDAVIVFSVVQYLPRGELPPLLARARRWLAPEGVLVVADVIPPEARMLDDIRALLGTAARHGFLLAALGGLAATFFSDYRRLRQSLGFAIYSEAEIEGLLRAAGFFVSRAPRNLGFHPTRRTYLGRV